VLRSSYRRKIHRYLRTKTWAARSRAFRQAVGYRCFACGVRSAWNHAHHLTYARAFKGREPDSDLLCLCPPCHRAVHAYAREHPELKLRTATFRALARG
jgi:predicted HNH restriction endonuclease